MLFRKILCVAGALILGLAPAYGEDDDKIIYVDGRDRKVDITQPETFAEVKYRSGGGNRSEDGKTILEVVHGDAPRAYLAGEGQRKGGQYEKAVKSYEASIEAPRSPAWVKVYAPYQIGECYRLAGEGAKALASYEKAAKEATEAHLIYPRILIGMGLAHALQESWGDAKAKLKSVSDGSYGLWRARADYELGNVLLAEGDMSEARRAFARVQSQRDDPSMQMAGTVGEGNSYLLEKNYRRAIDFFNRILSRSDLPRLVAAGAWAGIGDCEMAQAASGDKEAERRALLAYLTVIVQYAGAPEAYPKALFECAKIYDKVGKAAQAKALRRELKTRCPTSKYAKELKD